MSTSFLKSAAWNKRLYVYGRKTCLDFSVSLSGMPLSGQHRLFRIHPTPLPLTGLLCTTLPTRQPALSLLPELWLYVCSSLITWSLVCSVWLPQECNLLGTSLAVQWLGLHSNNAGSVGSIPGLGNQILSDVAKKKKKKKKRKEGQKGGREKGRKKRMQSSWGHGQTDSFACTETPVQHPLYCTKDHWVSSKQWGEWLGAGEGDGWVVFLLRPLPLQV